MRTCEFCDEPLTPTEERICAPCIMAMQEADDEEED